MERNQETTLDPQEDPSTSDGVGPKPKLSAAQRAKVERNQETTLDPQEDPSTSDGVGPKPKLSAAQRAKVERNQETTLDPQEDPSTSDGVGPKPKLSAAQRAKVERNQETTLDPQEDPSTSDGVGPKPKLSAAQRAKVERNRQRALLLKHARLSARPYPEGRGGKSTGNAETLLKTGRAVDTGAGFLLEEGDEDPLDIVLMPQEPGPILGGDPFRCDECGRGFQDSYLSKHFELSVCDECRDNDEKHVLITKTDARNEFLLKDADFDRREPPLKFITRKNPHNVRWGEMKLFLRLHVEKRALEVWGDPEAMEEAKEQREVNRQKQKVKKFDKKVKDLRRAVRTSMWTKDLSVHQHTYSEETYNEEEDMYSKKCSGCAHVVSYEKM